jgi:hypothetical protein
MRRLIRMGISGLLSAVVATAVCPSVFAQSPLPARLLVTVMDPTNGVLPGAVVTVTADNPTGGHSAVAPARTSSAGLATITDLAPGRYTITAEFPGFDVGTLKSLQLRSGDNKHVIVLALKAFQESVEVSQDRQAAALDPRGNSFRTQLTKEEMAALSDDPVEMAQQLIDLAGGNAIIKVDGFQGAALPPKALIKSIHIVRDTFPAENHSAESDEIDIITQPGVGPIHGGATSRLRDGSLSGRNPFVDLRAPSGTDNLEANFGGAIQQNKSSFSVSLSRRRQFDTPIATFATASGLQSELLGRRPNDSWSGTALFDYALTLDQTLRMSYDQSSGKRSNLGIGGYDLPDRAYSTNTTDHELRVQEVGPLGRRLYGNTRLEVHWGNTASQSVLEAPTVVVLGDVTSGGAQVAGGRRQRDFEFASDLDYVRGMHSVRGGVLFDGGSYRSDDSTNYLGTFVFSSETTYLVGQPASFTRHIGNPLISYFSLQGAAYIQDDIRLRKSLVLSPGLRYEVQTQISDHNNWGPRIGLTWAPTQSGHTTLRTSYGVFYNWLGSNIYEQTLRIDGVRQQQINIINPTFPDVGTAGVVNPTDRYLLSPDGQMARTLRFSVGIDQTLSPKVRVTATYSNLRFGSQPRGLNLNPLVAGVRADPAFANEIEVVTDASQHTQQWQGDINVNLAGGVRNASRLRWNPRRTTLRLQYRYGRSFNNTDGAFTPPPSGTLATEWAPAPGDRRHRIVGSVTTQALRNFSAQLSLNATSGTPYTVTTGTDDNGDGIFNDRPVGVGRDTQRLPWQTTLSANLAYTATLRPASERPGAQAKTVGVTVAITNVTNRFNFTGFSGVMTSPYFLQPTAVANPRQIDLSLRFTF